MNSIVEMLTIVKKEKDKNHRRGAESAESFYIFHLELKSCEKLEPIHKAQLLTYLKLSGLKLGLLLNFNVPLMRDGIVRVVNEFEE